MNEPMDPLSEPLVTLTTYWSDADAEVARRSLAFAGIESLLDPSPSAGTVRLRVRQIDALRASKVLDVQRPPLPETGEPDEDFDDPTSCIRCGSTDIERSTRGRMFALLAVIGIALGVAVGRTEAAVLGLIAAGVYLLISDRWRCEECGETWN
jgi:hypothetical protein